MRRRTGFQLSLTAAVALHVLLLLLIAALARVTILSDRASLAGIAMVFAAPLAPSGNDITAAPAPEPPPPAPPAVANVDVSPPPSAPTSSPVPTPALLEVEPAPKLNVPSPPSVPVPVDATVLPGIPPAPPVPAETIPPLPVPAQSVRPSPRPTPHNVKPTVSSSPRSHHRDQPPAAITSSQVPRAAAEGAAVPTATAIPQPSQDAPAAEVNPGWRNALAAWLQGNKTYPDEARRRHEEGRAVVRFTVERDGHVSELKLLSGTGSVALDAAVDQLLRGGHLPPFPASMAQTQLTITLQIRYSLEP